jgi:uncharacterized protein YutE (UPF0331/DUF86 family)
MIREKMLQDYRLLEKQLKWIKISFNECRGIGIKKQYSEEEFGKFETLCSRYSRGINFVIRKVFRTIDAFEFENQGTLIDVVNNAHKRGLINDIEEFRLMNDVRNTIVHEYIEDELQAVFEDALIYAEKLIYIMENTIKYINKALNE